MKTSTILCFGEVLWDCLPRGLFLGGAPCNVAYHLVKLGAHASVVSAVGDDFLGHEILRRLAGWGVDSSFVAVHDHLPTGTVQVDLTSGAPRYDIIENVAWDHIPLSHEAIAAAHTASAVVYGTLALRTGANRAPLTQILTSGPGLNVCDINLRPPYVDRSTLEYAIEHADVLKLNDEELVKLTGIRPGSLSGPDALGGAARSFAGDTGCPTICITCGARGAGLFYGGVWHWEEARPVAVRDTVGAGDAFLAALLTSLLQGDRPETALAAACRMGEFVASRDGATPSDHDAV